MPRCNSTLCFIDLYDVPVDNIDTTLLAAGFPANLFDGNDNSSVNQGTFVIELTQTIFIGKISVGQKHLPISVHIILYFSNFLNLKLAFERNNCQKFSGVKFLIYFTVSAVFLTWRVLPDINEKSRDSECLLHRRTKLHLSFWIEVYGQPHG